MSMNGKKPLLRLKAEEYEYSVSEQSEQLTKMRAHQVRDLRLTHFE